MADIRILTAFVTAANAGLVAFLLRRRGIVPALAGGVLLALFPMAVAADKTLMLEPYLLLFCLLGMVTLFKGDELAGGRRLLPPASCSVRVHAEAVGGPAGRDRRSRAACRDGASGCARCSSGSPPGS